MSDPLLATLGVPTGVQNAGTNGTKSPDAAAAQTEQVKRLAKEFEAMLMTQMLRDMRRSMLSDDESDGGLGRETMTDTMDVELGRALSNVGGFGLSNVLLKALEKTVGASKPGEAGRAGGAGEAGGAIRAGESGGEGAASVPTVFSVPAPAPVAAPSTPAPGTAPGTPAPSTAVPGTAPSTPAPSTTAPDLRVPEGRISSGYGWRRDPFTGAPQFHKGIDVAQRYGSDVQAAAAGRVVFAGHQGNYGTTIVVDHGGQKTRYAHLSATDVKAGDQVDSGQVIGKVGASGRATGAHLHFEVMD